LGLDRSLLSSARAWREAPGRASGARGRVQSRAAADVGAHDPLSATRAVLRSIRANRHRIGTAPTPLTYGCVSYGCSHGQRTSPGRPRTGRVHLGGRGRGRGGGRESGGTRLPSDDDLPTAETFPFAPRTLTR